MLRPGGKAWVVAGGRGRAQGQAARGKGGDKGLKAQ